MTAIIVAAVNNKGVIGNSGSIPWKIPGEQKFFQALTIGKACIMGRKTALSLKGPLPERENIYVGSEDASLVGQGFIRVSSVKEAIQYCQEHFPTIGIAFIGGAQIYAEAMQYVDTLWISYVDDDSDGDTLFPNVPGWTWHVTDELHFDGFVAKRYDTYEG